MKNLCRYCIYNFVDNPLGYYECTEQEYMNDIEFEEYENNGFVKNCPYFQEDESNYPPLND